MTDEFDPADVTIWTSSPIADEYNRQPRCEPHGNVKATCGLCEDGDFDPLPGTRRADR